jgi:hypothetical protein
MAEEIHDRLENEARESLVASELSAKMKQWRQSPPPPGKGNPKRLKYLTPLLMLLAFGGAAWYYLHKTEAVKQEQPVQSVPPPTSTPEQAPVAPMPPKQEPIAQQKPAADNRRFIALAQSNYRAPDFASQIRGEGPAAEDALNTARQLLANKRPAEAMEALKQSPASYQSDADYLRAHAMFSLKNYSASANLFGKLKTSLRYGEASEWYEVLALLPEFDRNKKFILSALQKISKDAGHTYQREAKMLLKAVAPD